MLPYLLYIIILVLLYPRAKGSRCFRFLLFLVATCFIGFRKDVGTDYESYTNYYDTFASFYEIGYATIALYLRSQNYDVAYLFFIMAALSYGILYLAVELNDDIDKGTTSFLLCLLTITTSVNGVRQFVAATLFMLSYYFIKKRKLLPYLMCILVGFLFHKSILIVLPLYFIVNKSISSNYYIIFYLVSFIFTTMSLQEIMGPFANFLDENDPNYAKYITSDRWNTSYFSIGVFVELLNYAILLMLSIKLGVYKQYPIVFNLFFALCIVFNLRLASPLFNRVQMYFSMYALYLMPLVFKRLNINTARLLTFYYIMTLGGMSIKYIFYTPLSNMSVYHDVFGFF